MAVARRLVLGTSLSALAFLACRDSVTAPVPPTHGSLAISVIPPRRPAAVDPATAGRTNTDDRSVPPAARPDEAETERIDDELDRTVELPAVARTTAPMVISRIRVRLSGAATVNREFDTQPDGSATIVIDSLRAGQYDIVLEGLETVGANSLIASYGRSVAPVTVNPGPPTDATVQYGTFKSDVVATTETPTQSFRLDVTFRSIPLADDYVVEFSTDPNFNGATPVTTADTTVTFDVPSPGTYHTRVRARNSDVAAAQAAPGDPAAVEVVLDSLGAADPVSAVSLGVVNTANQRVVDLNVFPADQEDWFRIGLSTDAILTVDVLTTSVSSSLNPRIELRSPLPDTSVIVTAAPARAPGETADLQLQATGLGADGEYFLVVGGDGSTVGHYTLVIDVSAPAVASVDICFPGTGSCPDQTAVPVGAAIDLDGRTFDDSGTELTGREAIWSSDDEATATVDARGIVTGIADGTANITYTSESLTTSIVVDITNTAPSAEHSTVTTDRPTLPADGVSTATVTVTVLDGDTNPVGTGGETVEIFADAGTVGAVTDNGDGTYSATYTAADSVQTVTVTGRLNGQDLTNAATIDLVEGASAATSTIAADPTTLPADGAATATITVQLKDSGDIDITVGGPTVDLTTDLGALGPVVDNGDGTYTAGFTAGTDAGTATITGTLDGSDIADDATIDLTPVVASVVVTPVDLSIVGIGNTAQLAVEPRDLADNPIGGLTPSYASLNPAVLTVDTDGLVTAVGAGQAIVEVDVDGVTGHRVVTVAAPGVAPVMGWTAMPNPAGPTDQILAIWGLSDNEIFAGGLNGLLLHFDGTDWMSMTSPTSNQINDIWGSASDDVWAIADGGEILRYDGTAWSVHSTVAGDLLNLWGAGPNTIFAVGSSNEPNTIFRYDGTAWASLITTPGFIGLWGTSETNMVTVGMGQNIMRFDGAAAITEDQPGLTFTFGDVWGSGPDDIFVVGGAGLIWHYDGTGWAQQTSGTNETLTDVWGAAPNDVYAVGSQGTLLRYDGTAWAPMTSGTGSTLWGLWGTSEASSVYAVGNGGTILKGTRLAVPSGATSTIDADATDLPADGAATSTITVQLKTAAGNDLTVGGATVTLVTDLGTVGAVNDNNDGTYAATLTASVTPGVATITGTVNGDAIVDDATVTLTTLADPATSSITAAAASLPANGTSTTVITVQTRDGSGTALTVGGDAVTLSTTLGSVGAATDQGDGTYTADLTGGSVDGTAIVTGTLNGLAIADDAQVVIGSPPMTGADPATSIITANPGRLPPDGSSTSVITVQLRDGSGTNITVGGDNVALTTTSGSLSAVTDNGDGTHTANLTATQNGSATITGTLNGLPFSDDEVVVLAFPADPSTSIVTPSQTSIPADGAATTTITVQARDANGNDVTTGGDVVIMTTDFGTVGTVTDHGDGSYTATLTAANTTGFASVTATLNGVALSDAATVTFRGLDPAALFGSAYIGMNGPAALYAIDPSDGSATPIGMIGFNRVTALALHPTTEALYGEGVRPADGTHVLIQIDKTTGAGMEIGPTNLGNPFGGGVAGMSFHTDGTLYGIDGPTNWNLITLDINTGNATTIGPVTSNVGGNGLTFNATNSLFHWGFNQQYAVDPMTGGSTLLGTVTVTQPCATVRFPGVDFDAGTNTFYAVLKCINGAGGGGEQLVTIDVNTLATTVIGPAVTGLDGLASATPRPTPSTAPASAATSVVTANPDRLLDNGSSQSTVTVQLRDGAGSDLVVGGDRVTIATDFSTIGPVTDNGDGSYTAILFPETNQGTATITATVNGQTIADQATVDYVGGLSDHIAFTSNRDGPPEIYIVPATGGTETRLTFDAGEKAEISPDGLQIAYTSGPLGGIAVMNSDGTNPVFLTNGTDAAWSPDGSQIAYHNGGQIFIINADGTNPVQITTSPGPNERPRWSPDASRLVFNSERAGGNNWDIYIINVDGTNEIQLTTDAGDDHSASFSPDGTKIVWDSNREGGADIWSMSPDGTRKVKLFADPAGDVIASYAPSRERMVIRRDAEIFTIDEDGGNPLQLTLGGGFNDFPRYGPCLDPSCAPTTGQSEIFVSFSGSGTDGDAFTYTVDGGPAAPVGLSQPAFAIGLTPGAHTIDLAGVEPHCTMPVTPQITNVVVGQLAQDVIFNVSCTAADAVQSTFTAADSEIPADGSSTTVLTLTLLDAVGAPIAGGDVVSFSTTLGTIGTVTDVGNGVYTAVLTAHSAPGTATITAFAGGLSDVGGAIQITFGSASCTTSAATIGVPFNGTLDAADCDAPDRPGRFAEFFTFDGTANQVVTIRLQSSQIDTYLFLLDLDGTTVLSFNDDCALFDGLNGLNSCLLDFTLPSTGTYTIEATSFSAGDVGDYTGSIIERVASPATSVITASPTTIAADGSSTSDITVELRDATDVPLTQGGDMVTVATDLGSAGPVTDNLDGTYSATLTSAATTGTANITGTVNGQAIANPTVVNFGLQPNLIVSQVTVPLVQNVGDIVDITADIVNTDNGAAPAGAIVDFSVDGNSLGTATLPSLAGGGGGTTVGVTNVGPFAGGSHSVVVTVDATGLVAESNEADNQGFESFDVVGPDLDLASPITLNPTNPGPTDQITFDASIINVGSVAAGQFSWEMRVDGVLIGSGQVPSLAGGFSTVPISVPNAGPFISGLRNLDLNLDVLDEVPELNESNSFAQTFVVAGADAGMSTITASTTSVPADGVSTATVTVQAVDGSGTPLTTGGDAVTLATDLGTLTPVTDNGNGTYTADLSGSGVGFATVTGTLNGVTINDQAVVTLRTTNPVVLLGTTTSGPTGPSAAYSIDPNTGAAEPIGMIGFNRVGAVDVDPNTGIVYAAAQRPSDNVPVLITIDPVTGVGTEIGPTGVGGAVTDLSIRSDGTIYGHPLGSVVTFNPSTGTGTIVGGGSGAFGLGMWFNPTNTLFMAPSSSSQGGTTSLAVVDQAIGGLTTLGNFTFTGASCPQHVINGVDYDVASGNVYASLRCGNVNPKPTAIGIVHVTAQTVDVIGPSVEGLDGLASLFSALPPSGPADPSNSTVVAASTTMNANGTDQTTITVTSFDASMISLGNGGDHVTLATDLASLGPVTDNGDGTYTATFTAGTTSGAATITATVNGQTLTDTETISINPSLLHQWTFGETGGAGTVLVDAVGGASATIVDLGSNDATVGGGEVVISGGPKGSSDYVDLPDGILSGLSDATIELWATHLSVKNWSRIFDFGTGTADYIMMTWTRATTLATDRVEWQAAVNSKVDDSVGPYDLGIEYHIVMTIDDDGGSGGATLVTWYRDGVMQGSFETSNDLLNLPNTENFLGRSQYPLDETANAAYNELRIYDGVLPPASINANFVAGPGAPPGGIGVVRR